MASLIDETGRRRVILIRVIGFEISEDHTTYLIEVQIDTVKWQVKRRFKEFHYLHETLMKDRALEMKSVAKFPPKKAVGNLTVKFVQERQKCLSAYLQSLATVFDRLPQPLTKFLLWEKYEIHGITGSLTEYLFEKGDAWLEKGYPFEFSVLQLYAVNQRMRIATPTCELGSSFKSDFGHLLDFMSRLESVKLIGSERRHGSSNLVPNNLAYDVTPFRRLLRLQLVHVNPDRLVGAQHLRSRLLTLSVRGWAQSIRQALLPEWPPHRQLSPEAPVFTVCSSADFSENGLAEIDSGVRLMPQLRRLRLRGNSIARLDNLDQLHQLAELDLAKNGITRLDSAHLLVGNLRELELAENRLTSLEGLGRLYGLVVLGLRANLISELSEVAHLAGLPLLSRLTLADNPLTQLADYRVRALQFFNSRASELLLDDQPATPKELDTVAVLQAIRRSREASVSAFTAPTSASPPALNFPPVFQQQQQQQQQQLPFKCCARLVFCPEHPMPDAPSSAATAAAAAETSTARSSLTLSELAARRANRSARGCNVEVTVSIESRSYSVLVLVVSPLRRIDADRDFDRLHGLSESDRMEPNWLGTSGHRLSIDDQPVFEEVSQHRRKINSPTGDILSEVSQAREENIAQATDQPATGNIPSDTDQPAAGNIPSDTDQPAAGNIPSDTDQPAAGNIPSDSDQPAAGNIPSDSDQPAAGNIPSDSDQPAAGNIPSDTDQPETGNIPSDTDQPAAGNIPSDTDQPAAGNIPSDTDQPAAGNIPSDTDQPAAGNIPSDTDQPAAGNIPSDTDQPAAGNIPSDTDQPAAGNIPSDTDQPAVSASSTQLPADWLPACHQEFCIPLTSILSVTTSFSASMTVQYYFPASTASKLMIDFVEESDRSEIYRRLVPS